MFQGAPKQVEFAYLFFSRDVYIPKYAFFIEIYAVLPVSYSVRLPSLKEKGILA